MSTDTEQYDGPEVNVTTTVGPWGMVPIWVLTVRDNDGKGLSGAELRVYIALRSFANQSGKAWPFVRTIAARADVSQRTAEKAIARMRSLRLLTTTVRHRPDGSIWRCDYLLHDIPPAAPAAPEAAGETTDPPGHMAGTPRRDDRDPPVRADGARTHHVNTSDEHTELNRRGADAARRDEDEPMPQPVHEPPNNPTFTDWRSEDYELFRFIIGADTMISSGTVWDVGEWPTEAWYRAFRSRSSNPIRWPGGYLHKLNTDGAAWEYLAALGLTAA